MCETQKIVIHLCKKGKMDILDEQQEELTDDEDFLELIHHVLHPRAPKVYRERPNHFNKWNDKEFKSRFRLEKQVVAFIIDQISEEISSPTDKYVLKSISVLFLL